MYANTDLKMSSNTNFVDNRRKVRDHSPVMSIRPRSYPRTREEVKEVQLQQQLDEKNKEIAQKQHQLEQLIQMVQKTNIEGHNKDLELYNVERDQDDDIMTPEDLANPKSLLHTAHEEVVFHVDMKKQKQSRVFLNA